MSPAKSISTFALGLMSGTSADGVSLALIEAGRSRLTVLADATYPYPAALKARILSAAGARTPELARLNFELGKAFARAAVEFLGDRRVKPARLAAAGSHGQTVIHLPRGGGPATMQLGEPSFLAEALGVPVVSDFRPRDMAAGGQGAPLMPFLDEFLFGAGPPRALQNIGGLANVALAGRGVKTIGFDTGPGNCLIDLAVRTMTGGRQAFDRDGRIASGGRVIEAAAAALLRLAYFSRRPPKSLERTEFGEAFLKRRFGPLLRRSPRDAVATLTYFTALSIADAYRRFLYRRAPIREVVLSGGGALNPVLVGHLRRLLAPLPVVLSAAYGIPPLAKEPTLMALMALEALRGRSNHCPSATGASGPRILGKITP